MWTASCFQNLQPYICSHTVFNNLSIYWGRKVRESYLLEMVTEWTSDYILEDEKAT